MSERANDPETLGEPGREASTVRTAPAADGCAKSESATDSVECEAPTPPEERRASGAPPGAAEPFRGRRLVSISLTLLFVATAVSGLVLALAPAHGAGRGVASIAGWRVVTWASFHSAVTMAFAIVGALHLGLNARALWCTLRRPRRAAGPWSRLPISRELLVALPVTALVVVAAVAWATASGGRDIAGRGHGFGWRHAPAGARVPPRADRDRGPRRADATERATRPRRTPRHRPAERPAP